MLTSQRVMEWLSHLTFATEAEIISLWGAGFILLGVFALLMDKRRATKRTVERLEKVGFMPWTAIFLGSLVIGGGLLALALPKVIGTL